MSAESNAEKARRLATENIVSLGVAKYATDELKLAAAQVHATLALVEQQTLANEIAFLRFATAQGSTITDEAGMQAFADRVVEGLGL